MNNNRKGLKRFRVTLCIYVFISLVLFILSLFSTSKYITSIIIGQAFAVTWLISIKYKMMGYLFFFYGITAVIIGVSNQFSIFIFKLSDIAITCMLLASITPAWFIISDIHDCKRLIKKGGIYVKGICINYKLIRSAGKFSSFTPIYEYHLDNKKYTAYSDNYFLKSLMPEIGTEQIIIVNPNKPMETYVPLNEKARKSQRIWSGILTIMGIALTLFTFFKLRR